jgi:hypothetical protein
MQFKLLTTIVLGISSPEMVAAAVPAVLAQRAVDGDSQADGFEKSALRRTSL